MRYGRKNPLNKQQRARRLRGYGISGYKRWIDPFPHVHGTLPEKMVYAALSQRGIPFYFLNDIKTSIPEINIYKEYQADFILPNQKVIIEVQGYYWHSKPGTIESDAFKFAMYQAAGYRPLAWWDFEIFENINKLFLRDLPQLASNLGKTAISELAPKKRTKVNTSKGIVTLNKKRAARKAYKKPPVKYGKRKTYGNSYSVGV